MALSKLGLRPSGGSLLSFRQIMSRLIGSGGMMPGSPERKRRKSSCAAKMARREGEWGGWEREGGREGGREEGRKGGRSGKVGREGGKSAGKGAAEQRLDSLRTAAGHSTWLAPPPPPPKRSGEGGEATSVKSLASFLEVGLGPAGGEVDVLQEPPLAILARLLYNLLRHGLLALPHPDTYMQVKGARDHVAHIDTRRLKQLS